MATAAAIWEKRFHHRKQYRTMSGGSSTRKVLPLIFLGAPGTGKGTQAVEISRRMGIPHISTGAIFRENVRQETPLGALAKKFMDKGELVSDEVVNKMVMERLAQPDCATGFLLDGYPRTVSQAEALRDVLKQKDQGAPVVVNLKVPYDVIVNRLSGRRTCPTCHRVYNLRTKPPSRDGVCNADGTELAQRSDDREEAIRERLIAYELLTAPLLDFYRRIGSLLQLDGEQPPEKITEELGGLLGEI